MFVTLSPATGDVDYKYVDNLKKLMRLLVKTIALNCSIGTQLMIQTQGNI